MAMPESSKATRYFRRHFHQMSAALLRIAFKRASEANYHLSFLPQVLPWLLAFRAASRPEQLAETAHLIRPLFSRAVAEHEVLLAEAGATQYLRKTGGSKSIVVKRVSSRPAARVRSGREIRVASAVARHGRGNALEPSLHPVFAHGVFWPEAASVSNPLGVTRAYAAHFTGLGGIFLSGDARSLHRSGSRWRVETDQGALDASQCVIALGPWSSDCSQRSVSNCRSQSNGVITGIFVRSGNAGLVRPVLDAEVGYLVTPMEQGIRITTGAEFAARDAAAFACAVRSVMPRARELFPLGERTDEKPGSAAGLACRIPGR